MQLAETLEGLISEDSANFINDGIGRALASELFQLGKMTELERLLVKSQAALSNDLGPNHDETVHLGLLLGHVRASLRGEAGSDQEHAAP